MLKKILPLITTVLFFSCEREKNQENGDGNSDLNSGFSGAPGEVKIMALDPGHFHASLLLKSMYRQIDSTVYVFAPEGPELKAYLNAVDAYNSRADNPTQWQTSVYSGDDFLEKMISEKPGNVMVTAGNNQRKTRYIKEAVDAGIHVLADKPMAIDLQGFELLKEAFSSAKNNGVLLYDMMTERYEITSMLQKEFSLDPEIFGKLEKGSPRDPAITKESVHHFFKEVSGSPLIRPAWFFDVEQEGNGIVDVTTHLVDLVQWACFPDQIIDYQNDIEIFKSTRWATEVDPSQFEKATRLNEYPDYLEKDIIKDSMLNVYANGEINYKIKDFHARVSVVWDFEAPEGAGDTHFSIMKGSKANLVIRQEEEQNFTPELYIEPVGEAGLASYEASLNKSIDRLQESFPGIALKKEGNKWLIVIPDSLRQDHEAHFGEVTQKFLQYLVDGKLPDWEVPNMISKYYTTTKALEAARKN